MFGQRLNGAFNATEGSFPLIRITIAITVISIGARMCVCMSMSMSMTVGVAIVLLEKGKDSVFEFHARFRYIL